MNEDDLAYLPAASLAPMIAARTISPVEVVDTILARIGRLEPRVNAFAYLAADQARAAARAAEAAVMRGDALGPLHGVPVTIKDLVATADMPMQSGSRIMEGNQPSVTAPIVPRLREAGAIVLGKTTTSEFGWTGVSRSPLTGITHNPWRHGLNAGASSAGAGAASAAGYGPLHQGSDGAGSIRMPAHFCGIYGLKPSFGRVPYWPIPVGDFTSHIGPMTRTVRDAAMMMQAMAGPTPLDFSTLESPPADYVGELGALCRPGALAGRRIAYSADLGHARVDPEVATLVRGAAERFVAAAGAPMEEVTPEWGKDGPELIRLFWPAHMSRYARFLPEWEQRMDPSLVACTRAGAAVTMMDYQAARERKYAYVTRIHQFFDEWDFLITPTVSVAAFPAERLQPEHWPQHAWDWLSWAEFSYPFNMSWNPAATVPCGFTADGLPVGLQIVGRRFDDLGVLQMSAAFEQALPWAQLRPKL
ncbi:MAG TPA: amidase family protein [Acetobacteraceae bacterium]|jgi:aspartyl-tRNA(Asn)/glutamyl-tRNA(Gln) amidotransferase subunit A|nr:amidase family protein [Acetobacteraceae bacterium]